MKANFTLEMEKIKKLVFFCLFIHVKNLQHKPLNMRANRIKGYMCALVEESRSNNNKKKVDIGVLLGT